MDPRKIVPTAMARHCAASVRNSEATASLVAIEAFAAHPAARLWHSSTVIFPLDAPCDPRAPAMQNVPWILARDSRTVVGNLTQAGAFWGPEGPADRTSTRSGCAREISDMDGPNDPARRLASRRLALRLTATALALGGLGAAGFARAAAKSSQKAVSYQSHPKGGHGCNTCKAFQPPSNCKTVVSPVEPSGWCSQYAHT